MRRGSAELGLDRERTAWSLELGRVETQAAGRWCNASQTTDDDEGEDRPRRHDRSGGARLGAIGPAGSRGGEGNRMPRRVGSQGGGQTLTGRMAGAVAA